MSDLIGEVNHETFDAEVLKSSTPVLVEFGAEWCNPCKMLKPVLEGLASEWAESVKVVELDVDISPDVAMQYQIMGVPTLMLFIGGEPRERLTGFQPKDRILSKINPHLQPA